MKSVVAQNLIDIHLTAPAPILAVGADIKSSVCLLSGSKAAVSQDLGGLSDPSVYRTFVQTISQLKEFMEVEPVSVACDMHPDYISTRYARMLGLPVEEIQHHHAHIMSCMAENGITTPVIGICCDGTGYGPDRTIWGCELLECHGADFTRRGHLKRFILPGGDAAARDTWRPALGLLKETFGDKWSEETADLLKNLDDETIDIIAKRMKNSRSMVRTSSLGRLFDSVAFILGLCSFNSFEGEAPCKLESAAIEGSENIAPFPFNVSECKETGALEIDMNGMVQAMVEGS